MRNLIFLIAVILFAGLTHVYGQFINIGSRISTTSGTVFNGSACNSSIPTIQNQILAENYDCGGLNISFFISNPTNPACSVTSYRSDYANLQTSNDGPAYQIGCTIVGNWYQYTVNVPNPSPCPCVITQRTGSPSPGGSWSVYVDGILATNIPTPVTGSYSTFTTVTSASIDVSPGNHTIKWQVATPDGNGNAGPMASFQFVKAGSGGVVCDEGPNYTGTLMADIINSGNTHCVLNADFTTSSTDVNGIKYSDVTTFIRECGGANHTYDFHVTYWYNQNGTNPCPSGGNGDINIVSDPLGGGFNVLRMTYTLADNDLFISACGSNQCTTSGFTYDSFLLEWPALGQNNPGLPIEIYVETTVYIPTNSLCNGVSGHSAGLAPNSTDVSGAVTGPGNSYYLAVDQFEINGNPFDSCGSSWGWNNGFGVIQNGSNVYSRQTAGGTFNFASGYNVLGQLVTSNGTDTVATCTYINGVVQSNPCFNVNLVTAGAGQCAAGGYACYFNKNSVDLFEFLPIAVTCTPFVYQQNPVTRCINNNVTFYYKSIRVFTCANYKTTQCPGTIITASRATNTHRYANDNTPNGLIAQAITWLLGKAG